MATPPLNPYFSQSHNGLNPYFNYNGETGDNTNEQQLVKNLLIEKIQQFGIKTRYILRTQQNIDKIYGESSGSTFSNSFIIEMDMETPSGMQDNIAMSQFGYNVTNTITLHCSTHRLKEEIAKLHTDRKFPMVGDIIHIPLIGTSGTMVEIKYIDDNEPFYVTGETFIYTLNCQIMDIGTETFSTGDSLIDSLNDIDENFLNQFSNNDIIQTEADNKIIKEPNGWPTILK